MQQKKMVLLFPDYRFQHTANVLAQNLVEVFEGAAEISVTYSCDLSSGEMVVGDLILLPISNYIFYYESIISELNRLMIISRAVQRTSLPLLTQFSKGSSVLVVNASPELTRELTNSLYEIGLNYINWVPYDPEADQSNYQGIEVAVHPGEEEYVPPFIRQSFDIGDRFIDTYSMVRIAGKLGLNNDIINSRLLLYSRKLAEPESSITSTYFDNYLKGLILKYYVHVLEEGLLLCDTEYHLLYANAAAQRLLNCRGDADQEALARQLTGPLASVLEENFTYDRLEVCGVQCAVTKSPIIISGVLTGYCITFREGNNLRGEQAEASLEAIRRGLTARTTFSDILCRSEAMIQCIHLAKQAAATDYSVLIEGESGTGKELLAQAIHNYSPRHGQPFVAINCAAMPESLLESELFGYEGGAFTGARRQGRTGLFQQADGGTIFLDEIEDMPPSLQAMLLRVLQEKQIMRLGGDQMIPVDVRIIAASNRPLADQVREKKFRADLFYRLSVLPVRLPPLRQRRADVPLLLEHFLGAEYAAFTAEQREFLEQYPWPGNVRQLQNFAAYYKTTHRIDSFFEGTERTALSSCPDPLPLIQKHSAPGHGIGRTALLEQLRAQGFNQVSDVWLRQELRRLEQAGFITVCRGRGGCRITPLGKRYLEQ